MSVGVAGSTMMSRLALVEMQVVDDEAAVALGNGVFLVAMVFFDGDRYERN
jgi:hypothetical protein